MSRDGRVCCFETQTGDVVWTLQLAEAMDVKLPAWGFTSSAFVLEDRLIFDAGRVVALNKHNGDVVWQTPKFKPGYGTPIAFRHDGDTLLAVLNNDYLLVVRASDGEEVARYEWETDYATNSTTPIPAAGTLFISTGYGKGCSLLTLKDGELTPVYENRFMRNHMNNCVLSDGFLYGFDGNSHSPRNVELVCMNHRTGEVQWTKRGLGCGSLMMSDGKLILLSDQGELVIAVAIAEEYREIARAKVLDEVCWTMPVLAHGRLYCRNDIGDVVCVDVRP
jgi:outer membrane protein assembly factor BamB